MLQCLCFFCFEIASDMAKLAEEVCGCRVQRLSGGMMGENTAVTLKHLAAGQPVLIPYLYYLHILMDY